MPEFFQTQMGQRFIEGTMTRIAESLETIANHLARTEGNKSRKIKEILVNLAAEDKLPLDMTILDESVFDGI